MRPFNEKPTRAEADAIVAMPKYITRLPRARTIGGAARLKTDKIYLPNGALSGLSIDIHTSTGKTARGRTPRGVLIYRGCPIRGVDWEVRHEFADGTVVEGWHEHLWDDRHGRQVGVAFAPPWAMDNDLETLFERVCQHWHIQVGSRYQQRLREADRGSDGND